MICVSTLCATVCAGLADWAFVPWPMLAGGYPVPQAVARESLGWRACSVATANGADARTPDPPAWVGCWRLGHGLLQFLIPDSFNV